MPNNILFVCNQNENRSKTAEELVLGSRSAGLYSDKNTLSREHMEWADVIVVFEARQVAEVKKRFPQLAFEKRIFNLDVKDIYDYGDKRLEEEVRGKLYSSQEYF